MYALRGNSSDFNFENTTHITKLLLEQDLRQWRSVGAIFFDGNGNNGNYLNILINIVLQQLQDFSNTQLENGSFQWWMQEGAPAHELLAVSERLPEVFNNCALALQHTTEYLYNHQSLLSVYLCGDNEILSIPHTTIGYH